MTENCPHGRLTTAFCEPCADKRIGYEPESASGNFEIKTTQPNSGSTVDYYRLPKPNGKHCEHITDLIYYKDMGWCQSNVFKAAWRWDLKPDLIYNLEKILWFATYALEKLHPGRSKEVVESATKVASSTGSN